MYEALTIMAADPPAPQNGATSQWLFQLLLAIAASGVLTALITAWFSRRKTAADTRNSDSDADGKQAQAAATLTGSALSLLKPMQDEMVRLAGRITALEHEQEASREREAELVDQLAEAKEQFAELLDWSKRTYTLAIQAGLDIEPPPGSPRTQRRS